VFVNIARSLYPVGHNIHAARKDYIDKHNIHTTILVDQVRRPNSCWSGKHCVSMISKPVPLTWVERDWSDAVGSVGFGSSHRVSDLQKIILKIVGLGLSWIHIYIE